MDPKEFLTGRNWTFLTFPWDFLSLGHVDIDPESTGQRGLSSAHLSQVSIREAVQVLLETTDMNCVLVPVGTQVRMVRLAYSTAASLLLKELLLLRGQGEDRAAAMLKALWQAALSQGQCLHNPGEYLLS